MTVTFSTILIPRILLTSLIVWGVLNATIHFGEDKKRDQYDWFDVFFGPGFALGTLYWGGFYS